MGACVFFFKQEAGRGERKIVDCTSDLHDTSVAPVDSISSIFGLLNLSPSDNARGSPFWDDTFLDGSLLDTSLVAQMVKRLPTMRETRVQSLGREGLLEKEMATHSSILPGKSQGWRSLVGYSPWGCKESDTTERLPFPFPFTVYHPERHKPPFLFLVTCPQFIILG